MPASPVLVPFHAASAPAAYATEAARWAAVAASDSAADAHFFYSVATTGVYCKPSCPSRLPRRENVGFFTSAEAARHAGFRACRRCKPDIMACDSLDVLAVTAAARMIDAAIADERPVPALAALAARAGFSPFHFHRLFRKQLGLTPKSYANAARAQRMEQELRAGGSVTEAIQGAGYSSASRFYDHATARLGMAPSAHRKGGAGETIRFATAECSLGLVLVAMTGKGVCAIHFGDTPDEAAAMLGKRFPQARLLADAAGFAAVVAKVVGLVEAPRLGADLPLDVRGTAFQERVWQALQAIPAGTTATYAEIAAAIGAPKAMRAVAGACAANPAAVLIPCHRVVRSNGDLSGYRWGVARKAELLKREGGR